MAHWHAFASPGIWAYSVGWEILPIGLLALLVAAFLLWWLVPYLALRLLMQLGTHSVLWMRLQDRRKVPAQGPVILLCNPLSYLGWLFVLVACPRRVRFVIFAGWANIGLPGRLLRKVHAITPTGTDSAAVEQTLLRAGECLDRGEVVCLFAEGCRTSDGRFYGFARVFEQVVGHRQVPVVPITVHQPHGSLFGIVHEKFIRRWPGEIPTPVWIRFGDALPAGTSAVAARQALQELSARLAIDRTPARRPVHRQFVRMAARHPFSMCWIDSSAPDQDMNYAKAYVGSVCLANVLRPILGDNPMVAIWLPPGRGSGLVNIALALLGKTSINLNYTASMQGNQSALRQCKCQYVLTAKRFTSKMPLDPGPGVEVIYLEDMLPKVGGFMKLKNLLSVILLPGWFLEHVVLGLGKHTPDDVATIIFSSGSTGDPKGVMLTHGNVSANAESMIQGTNLGRKDRVLGILPFFHSFGYTVTFWAPLQIGASSVYHADPRQAHIVGELCRKHNCTIHLSTATFVRFCMRKCEPTDFASLRILVCGAERLPPSLAEEFHQRFGILPHEGYGCTELAPAVSTNLPDQKFGGLTQIYNHTGTVGAPLPGVAGRLMHPDTQEALPPGEEGMLEVLGANVMKGYLNRPEMTAAVLRNGWYITGDMARIDGEGHITITGRLSRFAKIGGEMVPLEKVEDALHEVLATAERVCAVTCVPDESRGERVVVLYVEQVLAQFNMAVRPWCQQLSKQGLPNLWVPSERDFYAVEELPVLGSGKINLKGLKDLALDLMRK